MRKLLLFLSISAFFSASAQDQLNKIDVLNYDVKIELSNKNDSIHVEETISIQLLKDCYEFYLDLVSVKDGRGMNINSLADVNGQPLSYNHENDTIWISPTENAQGSVIDLTITYSGIPKTGMIIGKNKFKQRTFFGDNWPNRARHWFACVDHPSDKATINFTVIAPKKYKCIATGELISSEKYSCRKKVHSFQSKIQLPTKVMVIGLAKFKVEEIETDHDFALTNWVYSKDAKNGFKDMAVAKDVVDFFIENIGPYPYEKLANVQSTTQFGGMENAGNIFYDEGAVTGNESMEKLIAHEIAHQWFGNSASESDWQHLWLSEGFATYLTDLYLENKYGEETFQKRMFEERNKVIGFSKVYEHPVVDTTYESLMKLLNPNSYQKGAWFLHMLRTEVGDSIFLNGIRAYYEKFKFGNASTSDFLEVMNSLTSPDLTQFFNQWLRQAGHPVLKIDFDLIDEHPMLTVNQVQQGFVFDFTLEVQLKYEDGTSEVKQLKVSERNKEFVFDKGKVVKGLVYDPSVQLLFEMVEE